MKHSPVAVATTVPCIPTEYNGVKFRSRLEARWAVLFDLIGIDWRYEYEGFDLPSGWYLPDFYFPNHDVFAEVKPSPAVLVGKDWDRLRDLCLTVKRDVLFLFSEPTAFPITALIPKMGSAFCVEGIYIGQKCPPYEFECIPQSSPLYPVILLAQSPNASPIGSKVWRARNWQQWGQDVDARRPR